MFYVCWYFTWSWYIATLSAAMFHVCWYVIRLCSMFSGILFGLSALVFIVQLCSILPCYGWYAYNIVRPCFIFIGMHE